MYTHALIKVFRVSVGHAQDVEGMSPEKANLGDTNNTRERDKRRNISGVNRKTWEDTSGKRKHDQKHANL